MNDVKIHDHVISFQKTLQKIDVMIVSLTTQDIYRDQTVITITKLEIWR